MNVAAEWSALLLPIREILPHTLQFIIHNYASRVNQTGLHFQHLVTFFFSFSGWGETESTWYVGHCCPIVPAPDDRWWLWSSWWNEDWQGKQKYSEKSCPSATLSTTNPKWPDLGSNPGHRGGKPAINRLSYGTAILLLSIKLKNTDRVRKGDIPTFPFTSLISLK
jgi:hypothetical protein